MKEKTLENENLEAAQLWHKLSTLRNYVNHAGMKEGNDTSDKQIDNIRRLFKNLKEQYSGMKIFGENAAESD